MTACRQWFDYGQSSYCLIDVRVTRSEAAKSCSLPPNNGHLIYIENEEEFFQSLEINDMAGNDDISKRFWIGINDFVVEGEFTSSCCVIRQFLMSCLIQRRVTFFYYYSCIFEKEIRDIYTLVNGSKILITHPGKKRNFCDFCKFI